MSSVFTRLMTISNFKTLEPKDLFDNVVANLERLRNEPTGDSGV